MYWEIFYFFYHFNNAQTNSLGNQRVDIRSYENGENYHQLGRQLNLKPSSVSMMVSRYQETGNIQSNNIGGDRNSKVDDEMKEAILSIIDSNPSFTLNQINQLLKTPKILPKKPKKMPTTSIKTMTSIKMQMRLGGLCLVRRYKRLEEFEKSTQGLTFSAGRLRITQLSCKNTRKIC